MRAPTRRAPPHHALRAMIDWSLDLLDPAAPVRARHATHCLQLAQQSEQELKSPEQAAWSERVEREHDNLRAARGQPIR